MNLHLYPLLAASLEIYSKYVKHEKALGEYEKKKKKTAGKWPLDSAPLSRHASAGVPLSRPTGPNMTPPSGHAPTGF